MPPAGAELLIGAIAAVALLLAPLASRLVEGVGRQISRDLDRGLGGAPPTGRLDRQATAGGAGGGELGLRAEVRQLVIVSNERRRRSGKPPLDVEAEVERRLREASRS